MSWSEIFNYVVMTVLALLGSPLISWIKNKLGWEDRWAVLVAGVVATGLAFAELFLAGSLTLEMFTLENFAVAFTAVYTVAQVWFGLFKERD